MFKVKLFGVAILFLISATTYCGDNKPHQETAQTSVPEKSICELLSKEEVGKIMGTNFEEATTSLHTVDASAGSYVSQCGYYTNKGLQHVAVLVRHFKGTTFPQSAEEFFAASKSGDAEIDAEMDKALKNHIKVQGLGDFAFFYSQWESNSLVVHWDKSYEMIISMYKFDLDEPTIEKIKQLAQAVKKLF
ncbi:MAG: hypothetical protein MUE64_02510 [Ignavibacteriaceae bacterium]|nr:hypothetical protein [Ignavibacteriaceae bacterium]